MLTRLGEMDRTVAAARSPIELKPSNAAAQALPQETEVTLLFAPMQDHSSQEIDALTKALARGTGINLAGYAVRVILVFLHSFFGARLYGAEAYGVYTVGIAAASLLSLVGQIGLGRTITRFVALYRARDEPEHVVSTLKLALGISMPVSIGLGLVLCIWALPMARIFGAPALVSSFRILGLAVPALALATLLAAFTQGFKRMRHKVIALDIANPGAEVLGLLILAWLGARQTGLSIAYTLSVMLSVALLINYARLYVRRLARASANSLGVSPTRLLRPVLGFAMPVLAVNTLMSVTQRASILMLGVMGTTAEVGVFSILQRLVGLGTSFLTSTNLMFGPMVADLVERQRFEEMSRLYKLSTRWVLVVSLPFFFITGFYGAEILQVFGPEFVGGADALRYVIAAGIFNMATGSCGVMLMMSGHPQYSAINEAITLAIVVCTNLLFIPHYGLLGAVWAVAAGTVMVNALRVIQVWWHLRIHPYSWTLSKVAVATVAMIASLWVWKTYALQGSTAWPLQVLGIGVALLVYTVVLVLSGLEDAEMEMLRTLQRRLARAWVSSAQ